MGLAIKFVNIYSVGVDKDLADRVVKAFNKGLEEGGRRFITVRREPPWDMTTGEKKMPKKLVEELRDALLLSDTGNLYIPSRPGLTRARYPLTEALKRHLATAKLLLKSGCTVQTISDLWDLPYMVTFRALGDTRTSVTRGTKGREKNADDKAIGERWMKSLKRKTELNETRLTRLGAAIRILVDKDRLAEKSLGFTPPTVTIKK